jgi:hypothetical protein
LLARADRPATGELPRESDTDVSSGVMSTIPRGDIATADESVRLFATDLLWKSSNASTKQLYTAIRAGHARFVAGVGTLKTVALGIGIQLHALKTRVPRGEWERHFEARLSTLLGISFRTAQRYMAEARPYLAADGDASPAEAQGRLPLRRVPTRDKAADDDWPTPENVLAAAREYLGTIDFDPCASPSEPGRAAKTFCVRSGGGDGLADDTRWVGRVWAAPGCRSDRAAHWLMKAESELERGHLKEALVFVPASHEPPRGPMARLRDALSLTGTTNPGSRVSTSRHMDVHLVSAQPDLARFARAFRNLAVVLVPFRDPSPVDVTTPQPDAG